jgi:hypothetical protein
MSYYQLGQLEEARSELAQSREMIDNKFKAGLDEGDGNGYWFDWLLGRILLDEASSMIEQMPSVKSSASVK